MINKDKVLAAIISTGFIAIVRAVDAAASQRIAAAIAAGGARAIEVSYVTPGTERILQALCKEYAGSEVVIGAGTVLDPETARSALLAGAQFIICPALNPATVQLCQRYATPCLPGAMTPTEIQQALSLGADLIKLFPAAAFQPYIIKDMHAPFPQARLVPTGGVNIDNVAAWINYGAAAVGVGGELTAPAKDNDFARVTALTGKFLAKIKEARAKRDSL